MNRRGFFNLAAGLVGIGATSACCNTKDCRPKKRHTGAINTMGTQYRAPFIVSILSPENAKIELGPGIYPTFPNSRQAINFSNARMSLMRQNGAEAGQIVVMDSMGETVQQSSWGETWSQTTAYV